MRVAAMEGMEDAAATATGMGAVSGALLANLSSGDHLISSNTFIDCGIDWMPTIGAGKTF